MKKGKQRNQSSAAIMLRSLMTMVVVLTLALGLMTILAVGHQLLEKSARIPSTLLTASSKSILMAMMTGKAGVKTAR